MTFTDKILRWKLYLQDKDFDLYHVPGKEEHQFVPDALSRLCVNNIPPPPTLVEQGIVALVSTSVRTRIQQSLFVSESAKNIVNLIMIVLILLSVSIKEGSMSWRDVS